MNRTFAGMFLVVAMSLGAAPAWAVAAEPSKEALERSGRAIQATRDDLQAAYSAAARQVELFAAFAKKADEEKQGKAASLFRAAVRSRQVHAGVLKEAIEKGGGTATVATEPKLPDVKSTAENLKAALALAKAEMDTALPAASTRARASSNRDAARAFKYARESLLELARFYQSAIEKPADWSGPARKEFFVNRTCGYPVDKLDIQKCPVCFTGRDHFERID